MDTETTGTPPDVEAALAEGEVVLATGWAEVPMPRQGIVTFVSISMFIRLGYAIINRKRSADLRHGLWLPGFPSIASWVSSSRNRG